jgi:putative Ca2+/H+ antiporter (TMEM165/GDT1 family)
MDSLMAALVAALLIRATDTSADLTAIVAERSKRTGLILVGALVALATTQTVAAIAGMLVASHLTPNAARLMLAFSLLMAGGGAVWPRKSVKPGNLDHPLVAITSKLIATGLGDRTMFATFAVAAGGVPALAAVGGFIGGFVVLAAAAIAGETLWGQRPRPAIDWTIGGVLLIAGAWLAFSALRLI